MVDNYEIYFIPIVNPDGHEANTRHNANGVNLNRNYDVDWGNPLGMAFIDPMGMTKHTYENCGPSPFSEPEAQAMRDFMETLHNRNFAFYLPLHTANHAIEAPWGVMDPPFEMPQRDLDLFEYVLQWTRENTEYEGGRFEWGNETGGQPAAASGTAQDWCYVRHRVVSLTMEVYQGTIDDHSNLNYWMLATLPVGLYMLTNIEKFYNWETPNLQPVLPAGVPPSN